MIKNGLRINDKLKGISRKKIFAISLLLVIIASAGILVGLKYASRDASATLSGWNAGNIMDDPTMANKNSMTLAQIQSFLNSEYPGAKSAPAGTPNGYNVGIQYSGTTYYYHISNGIFVPLSQETFGSNGQPASSGQSAAQIIYNAAQAYSINPQVLIVLLQKESGVITDQWPNSSQYQSATGYGCPDSAACSSQYYGLINQINNAASFYHSILTGSNSGNYPIGNDSILYNPNTACGRSTVNVQNNATNALYTYTPYQPDAAALAAGYGTGDSCSAYGNRNFYNYFTDWFGSTHDLNQVGFLPNGSYYIVSSANTSSAIGFASGSSSGSQLQIFTKGSNDTIINISRNSDGTYTFKNPQNGDVLDIPAANAISGVNLQQYGSNGTGAQKWNIYNNSDGTYTFTSQIANYLAMDLPGGSTSAGTIPQLYSYNGTASQKYYVVPVSQPINNGQYYFTSNLNSISNLDISGGSSSNGAKVQLYSDNYTNAQKWTVSYNSNTGYYSVINANGKALDVIGAGTTNATKVDIYNPNGTCAQNWRIFSNSNSTLSLLSSCSGLALDIMGGNSSSGTAADIYAYNGTNAQKWNFISTTPTQQISNGTYTISTALSSQKVIDVSGGNVNNSTPVQIYNTNNTSAQKWAVSWNQATNRYIITNINSNKALDVIGAGTTLATRLDIYTKNGTCAQNWIANKQSDGSYELLSSCSGLALDLPGAQTNNGNRVQLYSRNYTSAQHWVFTTTN